MSLKNVTIKLIEELVYSLKRELNGMLLFLNKNRSNEEINIYDEYKKLVK
jgi:hypothetical protein